MTTPDDRYSGGQPTSGDQPYPTSQPGVSAGSSAPPVWGAATRSDDVVAGAAPGVVGTGPIAAADEPTAAEPAAGRRLGRPHLGRPHLGRPRLTPLRVFLGIALIGSVAVIAYGLIARDATQIPVLTAGEFITAIVFALLALAGAWAAFSRARRGESGKALLYALLGGVAALLSASAFAGAIIQTLILSA